MSVYVEYGMHKPIEAVFIWNIAPCIVGYGKYAFCLTAPPPLYVLIVIKTNGCPELGRFTLFCLLLRHVQYEASAMTSLFILN